MRTIKIPAVTIDPLYWCGHFGGLAFERGFSNDAYASPDPAGNGVKVTYDERHVNIIAIEHAIRDTSFSVSP